MPKFSVDYELIVSAQVDTDHDTVDYVVVGIGEFNNSHPLRVFNGNVDDLPEYLPAEHELARKAQAIGDRIVIDGVAAYTAGEIMLGAHLRPETSDGAQ